MVLQRSPTEVSGVSSKLLRQRVLVEELRPQDTLDSVQLCGHTQEHLVSHMRLDEVPSLDVYGDHQRPPAPRVPHHPRYIPQRSILSDEYLSQQAVGRLIVAVLVLHQHRAVCRGRCRVSWGRPGHVEHDMTFTAIKSVSVGHYVTFQSLSSGGNHNTCLRGTTTGEEITPETKEGVNFSLPILLSIESIYRSKITVQGQGMSSRQFEVSIELIHGVCEACQLSIPWNF